MIKMLVKNIFTLVKFKSW